MNIARHSRNEKVRHAERKERKGEGLPAGSAFGGTTDSHRWTQM